MAKKKKNIIKQLAQLLPPNSKPVRSLNALRARQKKDKGEHHGDGNGHSDAEGTLDAKMGSAAA